MVEMDANGEGTITSDLKEVCQECGSADCYRTCEGSGETDEQIASRRLYNAAVVGLERLILAAACTGVDVVSPAFVDAVRKAQLEISRLYE
jgi:hypothetical protein